jgi:ankyrin repeat protein
MLLVFFLLYLSVPTSFGFLAGLPKFLILYFKKPKGVVIDKNMFLCILAAEVITFSVIFFYPKAPLYQQQAPIVSLIDSLAPYSLLAALLCLKIFLIHRNLFAFFLVIIIFCLPLYGVISVFMHYPFRAFFKTKIGYFLYSLSVPLLLGFWILVAPLIWGKWYPPDNGRFNTDSEMNIMLYHAAEVGLPNVVKGLLEEGANVNFEYWKGSKGQTPLYSSFSLGRWSEGNRLETAKILIQYGADVNAKRGGNSGISGSPYLVELARRNDHELINLLLESGADAEEKDQFGKTYLDYIQE